MAFNDLEQSADRGEPVDLYKFVYGPEAEDCFRYTDYEAPLVLDGEIFYPTIIARGDINSAGTTDKSTLEVEMPTADPVAELFRVYPPSFPVGLQIWQGHATTKTFALQWSGKVLSCSRAGLQASLTCEPSSISMQRIGLRRNYQYMCPHVLYGAQCKANKAAATVSLQVAVVSGRLLTLTGLLANAGEYAGGLLEWENTTTELKEYRTILSTATVAGKTVLTISAVARGVPTTPTVKASKGCAHTLQACNSVHNNAPNYGGQPFIPTKNPLGRSTPFL